MTEILDLKNELAKAKKIIEQQKLTIKDLENKLNNANNNNNNALTQSLNQIIYQKDQELNKLNLELKKQINHKIINYLV